MNFIISAFKTIYESFWGSIITAFLFSLLSMLVDDKRLYDCGWRTLLLQWLKKFITDKQFRHKFFFYLYTALILYQTLLGRTVWSHPLEAVYRDLRIIDANGTVNMQVVGNILLFVPFTISLFFAYGDKVVKERTLVKIIFKALKITATVSFLIEFLQALFHLGTLQISDFCYNVIGGILGGLIYWCGYEIKHKRWN